MNKYIVEFIGTFFLVLTIGCNVLGGNPLADHQNCERIPEHKAVSS